MAENFHTVGELKTLLEKFNDTDLVTIKSKETVSHEINISPKPEEVIAEPVIEAVAEVVETKAE